MVNEKYEKEFLKMQDILQVKAGTGAITKEEMNEYKRLENLYFKT